MQPATYLVRLELAGYEPWQKTIALGAARDTTVDAVLRPAQGAKGKLEIRATPYALQFYVDGKEVGTESPLVTVDVDASVNHSVRITHPTCGEKKWDVQVGPGQVRSLAYNFTKDAGSLKISCPKGYGYVLLDGVRTGKDTPYDNDCVPSGTHTVSLYRTDGSYAFEGPSQVEILPGRESRVVFKMIEK